MADVAATNGATGGDLRASILADMAGAKDEGKETDAATADDADDASDTGDDEEGSEVEATADDEDADSEDGETESDDEADDEDEVADPKVRKGLDQVRVAEKRSRDRIEGERREFAQQQQAFVAEWQPRLDKVDRWEKLASQAKTNPYALVDLLNEIGVTDDEYYEPAAQALFAHSTKGKADPKNAAVIAQSRRERQLQDEIAVMRKRLDERETNETKAQEQAKAAEQGRAYMAQVMAVPKDKYPLLSKAIKADKDGTYQDLGSIAMRLWDKTGAQPEPKAVRKEFERLEAARLKRYGHEPAKPTKTANDNKAADKGKQKADDKKPAKKATKDEIIAEMAALRDDDRAS